MVAAACGTLTVQRLLTAQRSAATSLDIQKQYFAKADAYFSRAMRDEATITYD